MFLKQFILFCLVAAVYAAPELRYNIPNIKQCDDQNFELSEQVVFRYNLNVPASLGIVKKSLTFPEQGIFPKKISCITITHKGSLDESAAYVSVDGGGVGSYFANIAFKSKLWRGLNYEISIWTYM